MKTAAGSPTQRSATSGYWGRDLVRRKVGNAVFQLHEANAPPEAVTAHGHHGAHIVFVTSGAYVTSVTGENGFVATPVAVMNPPGTWHRDHFVGGRGSFMTIDLECDGLQADHPSHDQSHTAISAMVRIASRLQSADAISLEEDAAALCDQFGHIRRQESQDPVAIIRAHQAIMDSDAPWTLTVKDLAAASGLHPNSLPRAFRSHYGRTPSQIAKARQVELCGASLARKTTSLADAAVTFGFYDQAHMSNAFRRVTGLAPGHWLKEITGG